MIPDDRRGCPECRNLSRGQCVGEIVASPTYRPAIRLARRCGGYAPDDPDQRPGRERWPECVTKGNSGETGYPSAGERA